jgi:bifunctional UDP-N-acetylglucosamine pyrophosphorylase/glucosamine-1-phosphate N-acetyltransferase
MTEDIRTTLAELGASVDDTARDMAVILAAGHGKRIKSSTSKMLHEIWGKPSVVRIVEACRSGLDAPCLVVVVGIKAEEVARAVARRERTVFAYQAEQRGTGHAVACALEPFAGRSIPERVYVFPGDMGLLHAQAVREFKDAFDRSDDDMVVMTGLYDGPPTENYYGRIVRVPDKDATGRASGADRGKVIEIREHKDILALGGDYEVAYRGRPYRFTKDELLGLREFNTSVYAFKGEPLRRLIGNLGTDNVQGEVYLTDLIAEFNRHGLKIGAVSPSDPAVVLGFNNKSVLRQMEDLARRRVYDALKDILTFEDPDDFFIADDVVEDLIRLDREHGSLDVFLGAGARVGEGVRLNVNARIVRQADLAGAVVFGRNVTVGRNVHLSAYPHQTLVLGDNVEILAGDIVKGDVRIGDGSRNESGVNVTGSDEYPTRIGRNVLIKGTSYIFGSVVEDDVTILHSILVRKHVERIERKDGTTQAVRLYLPLPEGIDCVSERPAPGALKGNA